MGNYIIIGGSSGIGLALVKELIQAGNQVSVLSREARELTSLPGVKHYSVDISEENPAFPELEGPIDGLAYCPGTINLRPFTSLKIHDFEQDWNVNLLGAVKAIKEYLPHLKKSESASVVLFSTVAVQTGMPYHASVAASKGAIEGLTKSLAAELAPKIRVNAIAPSLTDTPLAARLLGNETRVAQAQERNPLHKVGTAEEVAKAAYYLLSKDASWVSGQIMHVDGGMSTLKN